MEFNRNLGFFLLLYFFDKSLKIPEIKHFKMNFNPGGLFTQSGLVLWVATGGVLEHFDPCLS